MFTDILIEKVSQEGVWALLFAVYLLINTKNRNEMEKQYLEILNKVIEKECENNEEKNNFS